jgi:hypothetical protein
VVPVAEVEWEAEIGGVGVVRQIHCQLVDQCIGIFIAICNHDLVGIPNLAEGVWCILETLCQSKTMTPVSSQLWPFQQARV